MAKPTMLRRDAVLDAEVQEVFLDDAERRDTRVAIRKSTYDNLIADAREQESARKTIAIYAVTATLGFLGYYVHLRTGATADPSRLVLTNWLWPMGFLLLLVIQQIGKWRYVDEVFTLERAAAIERRNDVLDGAAATKLSGYRTAGYWMPGRVDIAVLGCAVALAGTMIIHHALH